VGERTQTVYVLKVKEIAVDIKHGVMENWKDF